MRLKQNGKLVERITIKIEVHDTGKWEWTVRQRFLREPRIKINDLLSILDAVKEEILSAEKIEEKKEKEKNTTT